MMESKAADDWVRIQEDELDLAAAARFLATPGAGGIDLFIGTTRQWTGEDETVRLEYECYPSMAIKEIGLLIGEAREQWPVMKACVFHRLGVVPVAQASVIIGVATAHRAAAFEACRFLIDRLKVQVPIWKREVYADGRTEWVQGSRPPDVSCP
jgi:molybdopterin synthase catalytic subunit